MDDPDRHPTREHLEALAAALEQMSAPDAPRITADDLDPLGDRAREQLAQALAWLKWPGGWHYDDRFGDQLDMLHQPVLDAVKAAVAVLLAQIERLDVTLDVLFHAVDQTTDPSQWHPGLAEAYGATHALLGHQRWEPERLLAAAEAIGLPVRVPGVAYRWHVLAAPDGSGPGRTVASFDDRAVAEEDADRRDADDAEHTYWVEAAPVPAPDQARRQPRDRASLTDVRAHTVALREAAAHAGATDLRVTDNGTLVIHSDDPGYRHVIALAGRAQDIVGTYVHVITDDVPAATGARPL